MPYDNSQRLESARATRRLVLEAAKASFLARGYGATTIRRVAEDAGVSQETIYKSFGGKAALLKSVYDVALVGDDEDAPLAARPEALAVREATSPSQAARAYAELAQTIASRVDPLLRVLLGVRDTDAALEGFARTTDQERRAGATFFVTYWADAGWVRADVPLDRAIDTVWALNSPQMRWLLMDHGWTGDEYARWLASLIHGALFVDDPT